MQGEFGVLAVTVSCLHNCEDKHVTSKHPRSVRGMPPLFQELQELKLSKEQIPYTATMCGAVPNTPGDTHITPAVSVTAGGFL